MPTITEVTTGSGSYNVTSFSSIAGTPYLLFVSVRGDTTLNASCSDGELTLTKVAEFSTGSGIGDLKVGIFQGVATASGTVTLSAFATGGDTEDAIFSVVSLAAGKTSSPIISVEYIESQSMTPVASTTQDGIDITSPAASGRFIQALASRIATTSGSAPDGTPAAAGWTTTAQQITSQANFDHRLEIFSQTSDNGVITPIECDITWNAFSGTDPKAFQVMIWLAPSNSNPSVPTGLTKTGSASDTTPSFECSIDDIDFDYSEQVKARFSILNDSLVEQGTIDSSFVSAAGVVSAEYTSALPVGSYFVRAKAIDDSSAESAYSANVAFNVYSQASKDLEILHKTYEQVIEDLEVLFNVEALNIANKDIEFLHNTARADPTFAEKDLEILYDVIIGWSPIEPSDTIWEMIEV